jgi:hypothetical protein
MTSGSPASTSPKVPRSRNSGSKLSGTGIVATAIIFAPYLFYPEVRLYPGSWVYPYLGSNLDFGIDVYSGRKNRYRYLYGMRGGLNFDLILVRFKLG